MVVRHLPWRRILNLLVVAIVIGTVAALALTRSGQPASAMRLFTGDAWLANASVGTVSHVNGYTGGADAQQTVGEAGDPFEVVQRAEGAYVLDLRTGRLSRLDDSTLNVTTAVVEPRPAMALQIITGTTVTWILDRSSGVLQQVSPTTLRPIDRQIPLGGSTGAGVVDGAGSLWVPLRAKAAVVNVRPGGTVIRHVFGHPGDDIQIADTASGVWALDPQAKLAASMSVPGTKVVALPALPNIPLVGASGSSPNLVVVAGGRLLDVNTSRPSLSSLEFPAAASASQVVVSSNKAYLLNQREHRLLTLDLSPIGVAASTAVPVGADQLVAKDQLVFVNSSNTPQALVVSADGTVTAIDKYRPLVRPQPHLAPSPAVPSTTPVTSPSALSSGPPSPSPTSPSQGSPPVPVPLPATPSATAPPLSLPGAPPVVAPSPTSPVSTAPRTRND